MKINIGGVIVEMENEVVSKGIETGELKITTDKLIEKTDDQVIYSKPDFDIFKTNLSNDEYNKGKIVGREMMFKEAKEKYSVDFEGKTLDKFVEAYKAKVIADAKIKPDEKIKELTSDNDKLRSNYTTLENDFTAFKNVQSENQLRVSKDQKILSFIPENGLKVDRDIALIALKAKSGIDINFNDDKGAIVTQNGVIQKDEKTLQPVDIKTFILENITALNLLEKNGGGAGGSDETGGGNATSYDLFVKEMEIAGNPTGSMAFTLEMSKRQKDGTLKV